MKADPELQFCVVLLSEVISIRGVNSYTTGAGYLLKVGRLFFYILAFFERFLLLQYLPELFRVLDRALLVLHLKDEYENLGSLLQNVLYNLLHPRPVETPVSYTKSK